MKLAFAAALGGFQSLQHDDTREKPVDRLAALGAAQWLSQGEPHYASLGVDLIAFKWGRRATSHNDAVQKLSDILGWKSHRLNLRAKDCVKVSAWAIREWTIDVCPTCYGAGEIPDAQEREGAQPMKICHDCHGSRMRKYSNTEREVMLGEKQDKALGKAHEIIGGSVGMAIRRARRMLERE